MTDAERARALVLRHALDPADAAELLDMLGLGEDQLEVPRVCEAPPARRRGTVHAVSAATEARLALPPEPEPVELDPVKPEPAVPVDEPSAAAPTTEDPPAHATVTEDRRCEGCGTPVVPQTRYRLDRDGYRARGVRLLAAKGRCWQCYQPPKGPTAKSKPKPKPAAKPAKKTERVVDGHAELRAERDALAERLAVAERERDEACERLAQASLRIAEMQVEVGRIVALADELAAAAEPSPHRHAWEWQPELAALPLPCSCGEPSPGGA